MAVVASGIARGSGQALIGFTCMQTLFLEPLPSQIEELLERRRRWGADLFTRTGRATGLAANRQGLKRGPGYWEATLEKPWLTS